jgi:dTDP-L-rhamnose 4-epimerase
MKATGGNNGGAGMKKILVTGGAGFVGSHTVDALLARGYQVRVLDSLTPQVHPSGRPSYLARDVELVRGDVREEAAVREAIRGVDAIFHMAAAVGVGQSMYEIAGYMGANTQGTAVLLQALLDANVPIGKLVVASSMSIYGEGKYFCEDCGMMSPGPRSKEQLLEKTWESMCPRCPRVLAPVATDESKPLQVTSIYALSKKDQEEMCLLFGRTYGLPVVAMRYFNIYGTRQALSNPYTGVAAIFASRLMNGRAPLIFEDGRQMRDFVSVEDVVQANLLALESSDADGMALNIGSGEAISICAVAQALSDALGRNMPAQITGKYRAGDIRHCFADISLASRTLGYKPQVKFSDGITGLVDWLRSQSAEDRSALAVEQLSAHGLAA